MSTAPTTSKQKNVQSQRQPQPAEQMAPSPTHFFWTATSHMRSGALKSAIELNLFTAIAEGAATAEEIARRCQASERGIRILCDFLTINGFMTKEGNRYELTHDSFVFLNRHSPAYVGSAVEFLVRSDMFDGLRMLTDTIRQGTRDPFILEPDNPMWVTFARAMGPMALMQAGTLADVLEVKKAGPMRLLDIAAGHGHFGITVAKENRRAEVVAVDWPHVLEVAKENAQAAGVADRYRTIAGSALEVDLGNDYDVVLVTNFLHHFDSAAIVGFLKRLRSVLKDGGRVAALEFVPNDDRITPQIPAAFSMMMLAMTPSGDAYTFKQYQKMFADAGFRDVAQQPLPPSFSTVVTASR